MINLYPTTHTQRERETETEIVRLRKGKIIKRKAKTTNKQHQVSLFLTTVNVWLYTVKMKYQAGCEPIVKAQ